MTRSDTRSGISPALAAFLSGAASTILTIVATLVTLRSSASADNLFNVLLWLMYCVAGATGLVLFWIITESLKTRLAELHYIRRLHANVPHHIKVLRRTDELLIGVDGAAKMQVACELESAESASIAWFTFPVSAGLARLATGTRVVTVARLLVDGVDMDTTGAFRRTAVKELLGDPQYKGIRMEEGYIRIPIALEPTRRRCSFVIELELAAGSFMQVVEEEFYLVDISHITDEINVILRGVGDLEIMHSPLSDYTIKALPGMGEAVDPIESQLQSPKCRMKDGVRWRSDDAKIGYRYDVRVVGRIKASRTKA